MGEREAASEADAIQRVDDPVTVDSLVDDLRGLGVDPGGTVLVHSSLSALGWVVGGAPAVVDALRTAVTDAGTLVMPTFTPQYADPAGWENPPVPAEWAASVRGSMPPFRPLITPTRGVGAIPECFRTYPDVVRGEHPEVSFAAWGRDAASVATDHRLDDGLGEGSPLARLYERDADVLLLGVGHAVNTSFHLAEYRAAVETGRVTNEAPVRRGGERVRVEYGDVDRDAGDFPDLGADFEREVGSTLGTVGAADARLASQRALVDFAVEWFEANRPA